MTVPNWFLPFIQQIADEFCAIHPDVTVTLNTYDILKFIEYRDEIRFPIMSGQKMADDIIQANCFTPWDYLKHDWMFVDFYELMENDPDFAMDDHYESVFDGLAMKGKLFEFPIDFLYCLIGISADAPAETIEKFKQYDAITFGEVFDLYNSIPDRGDRYVSDYCGAHLLFLRNLSAYVDFERRTCNLNDPGFVKLITDAKNATHPDKVSSGRLDSEGDFVWQGYRSEAELKEFAAKYFFHVATCESYQLTIPSDGEEVFTHFIPLLNENGKVGIQTAVESWSIPATSENKEAAWEFIKFMATQEGNKGRLGTQMFVQFVPNKEFFRTNLPITLEKFAKDSIKNANAPFNSFLGDVAGNSARIVDMYDGYNQMPMDWYWLWDPSFTGNVLEIMRAFYAGAMSAEQVASELNNRVTLLLLE